MVYPCPKKLEQTLSNLNAGARSYIDSTFRCPLYIKFIVTSDDCLWRIEDLTACYGFVAPTAQTWLTPINLLEPVTQNN